jgi:adenylosuccinate synthase
MTAVLERPLTPEQHFGEAIFVVGLQYGDEGKGKIVDLLAAQAAVVARGNGGANAGHTIVLENGKTAALHQLPSGIAYSAKLNVIGHGVLVDAVRLWEEITEVREKDIDVTPENLAISGMAQMVFPKHKAQDAARESGKKAQGSTKAGIAYAASDHSLREGIRVEALQTKTRAQLTHIAYKGLREAKTRKNVLGIMRPTKRREARELAKDFVHSAMKLVPYIRDTPQLLNDMLEAGDNVLVEGAQAHGLDKHHGKYPYVTSTGTTIPALIEGTGINPKRAGKVIGIVKATPSKVGGGSFVSKIKDETIAGSTRGNKDDVDGEYGATTGREREVGYLDLVALKRAIMINGVDEIALTKFDCIRRHGAITKIAIAYRQEVIDEDGSGIIKILDTPPSCDEELARCEPIYKDFPTWEDDTSQEAQNYLDFIERYLKTKITMVSNGPERDQVIMRNSS